jgi:hypothetical protein
MIDFSKMTNAELKEYAKDNNIDVSTAKNKTELIAKITGLELGSFKLDENIIDSKTIRVERKNPESSTLSNDNNVVSSRPAEKTFQKIIVDEPKKNNQSIIYSEKNLHWGDVGNLKVGYNVVSKEDSEKWLKLGKGVREATPEEVATYYGL